MSRLPPTRRARRGTRVKTPTYNSWMAMRVRCFDYTSSSYEDYGARGVIVCRRWATSYDDFLQDMGERPSLDHSLDRIDPRGNYEPGNCRWATVLEQNNNQRDTTYIDVPGEGAVPLGILAARCGVPRQVLRGRLVVNGWELGRAMTTLVRAKAANGAGRRNPNNFA